MHNSYINNHSLAYISPEAKIGKDVVIEPFSVIHKDVEIGDGTWIGSNVVIMDGARIGKNCKIFPGAVISAVPQDLKFKGEVTTAEIGDNTTIRECVTINRGTVDKYTTKIGSNCLVMAYVHVGHDCIIGDNVIIGNSVQLAGHVIVEDYAIFGGTCAVQQFTRIGSHVYIGGGSLVRKDVPPFTKAAREPLAYCGINTVGLKRRGYTNEQITEIQDIYRIIFVKAGTVGKAIEEIEATFASSEIREEILGFIKASEHGIMKGYDQ